MNTPGKSTNPACTAAALPLFLLAALFATWPLGISSQPYDHADTLFNSWLIQWNLHALSHGGNPLTLPIFAGFPDGQGRSDLLVTQSLLASPLFAAGTSPVRTHNVLMIVFLALAGYATMLLALETGGSGIAGLFAGTAVVLMPYFQSHLWHIQLFSPGLSILALLFALRTARGVSSGWQTALFILLQCLASLYLWYFLNLALVLLIPFIFFSRGTRPSAKIAGWWAAGNAACLPFLTRHLSHAGTWSADTIASTDLSAFMSPWSSSVLLGWMRWDHMHPEAALWPGLAVTAGFVWFLLTWKRNWTDGYLISCVIVFTILSLGPTLVVFGHQLSPAPFRVLAWLPGGSSIRLPARGAIFALVPMAVLAGRKLGAKGILAFAGILLAAAGLYHKPLQTVPLDVQPWNRWIAANDFQRILYLPISYDLDRPEVETLRLIGSVSHFTPSVNGYSTTLPENYSSTATILNSWPSPEARRTVEELQVDCIIVEGPLSEEADTVFHQGRLTVSAVVPGGV